MNKKKNIALHTKTKQKINGTVKSRLNWIFLSYGVFEITNRRLIDLEPWSIMEGEYLQKRFEGLQRRYPEKNLIPFARRIDNDDIACWQKNSNKKGIVIHDFASHDWDFKVGYINFWSWFKQAIDDMIQFIK